MNITLLVLRCGDLENTKGFYEKLGLFFCREQHGAGPLHYSAAVGGMILELYPGQQQKSNDNIRLGFKLDDM